jgi:hypothetical protein
VEKLLNGENYVVIFLCGRRRDNELDMFCMFRDSV